MQLNMKMTRKEFGRSLVGTVGLMMGCPGCLTSGSGLRYACKGELHKDFHASILDGVNYLIDNYGEDAAREVLTTTAHQVYRTMHEKLVRGDSSELIEWWRYYLDREQGDYRLDEKADGSAVLTVAGCPALAHLKKRGIAGGRRTCWATRVLNDALCQDSPFEIVTEETSDASCRQVLRKRGQPSVIHHS